MLRFFRSGGVGQVLVAGVAFAIIVVFALEFRTGSNSSTAKLTRECAVSYAGNCLDAGHSPVRIGESADGALRMG